MKKTTTSTTDPWNDSTDVQPQEVVEPTQAAVPEPTKPYQPVEYSLAGLKADFPTARELEQFVFDERAISLKLRGIDPERKYEVALAVLNNEEVDLRYISGANPYVDNTELIPEDPIKPIPARDPRLPNEPFMSIFHDRTIPHPNQDMRALDAKVVCQFKTYEDGTISYEIIGPLEKHSLGEKLDKYGRSRPEKIVWIDPRTGEQGLRYADGSFSKMGQRLRTLMESRRVNRNASFWSVWIDRDFTQFNQDKIDNPWD